MFEFDQATAIENGIINLSDQWCINTVPNGGYSLACGLILAADQLNLDLERLLSVSAHYLRALRCDEISVQTAVLKQGKQLSTYRAQVMQDGAAAIDMVFQCASAGTIKGPEHFLAQPPVLPDPQKCWEVPKTPNTFTNRVNQRGVQEDFMWFVGQTRNEMEYNGWMNFSDARPLDRISLAVFADAFPPPVLQHLGPIAWVPTLNFQVQFRASPIHTTKESDWLQVQFFSRALSDGIVEEDGFIWDQEGRLLAVCRQMALAQLPEAK